jgi:hypothetical protein
VSSKGGASGTRKAFSAAKLRMVKVPVTSLVFSAINDNILVEVEIAGGGLKDKMCI